MKAFAVTTGRAGYDLDLDIVLHDKASADKHARELREMGCEQVKVREFDNEDSLYDWYEAKR